MAFDPEWLVDLFEPFGPVRLRRMFSGHGVYAGEFCVALAIASGLCMRVDEQTRPEFEALGAQPFTYTARGKTVTVNAWWRLPEALLDEPDEIARWARLSLEVARRLPPKKKRPPKAKPASKPARKSAGKSGKGA